MHLLLGEKTWNVTSLFIFVMLALPTSVIQENFTVGYLANFRGYNNPNRQGLVISGAISYALQKINRDKLLGNNTLHLIYNDTLGEVLTGTKAVLQQWNRGVIAFFGPEDSCDKEAAVAAAVNLPMISYKCADHTVSDKSFYKTFARTFSTDNQVVRSVIALLTYYKWRKFSIITEDEPRFLRVSEKLEEQSKLNKMVINTKSIFRRHDICCEEKLPCCKKPFMKIVKNTYKKTRVYVVFGIMKYLRELLILMRMLRLFDEEYIVIYVHLEWYKPSQSHTYFYNPVEVNNVLSATMEAARSLLVIVPSPVTEEVYVGFHDEVRKFNQLPPFNLPSLNTLKKFKKQITEYAALLYDAVFLYAEALSEVLKEDMDPRNGTYIIQKIIARGQYRSIMGQIMHIDQSGDVEGNYTVLALQPKPKNLKLKVFYGTDPEIPYTMLPVGMFFSDPDNKDKRIFQPNESCHIPWVKGRVPLDEPPCGYDGSGCKPPPENRRKISAGVMGSLLLVVIIISTIVYRNWVYEQKIAGLLWKLDIKDLEFPGLNGHGCSTSSRVSLPSQVSLESRTYGHMFTQTAVYKGKIVAVKQMTLIKKTADIPREIKKEMKLMRELYHDNINSFIGACVIPNKLIVISEYCPRGSLQDILENEDIRLDNMFIASLVFDLIKGLNFLHETELRAHGNLKSSNCVVTSRWVLNITDFGLHELRNNKENESTGEYEHYRNLLWKAPEHLRDPYLHPKGTKEGDIYSFGIILHEIIGRQGPYGGSDLSPKEIIKRVKDMPDINEAFRPNLSILECQDYVLHTMCECWSERPEKRPDFREIRSKLARLRQGIKLNIMDNMMDMMEKYANNLEDLVDERTALLLEEKKKTEALLHRMLPKSVAAQLKRGEPVIPEAFNHVTIYFSDIVGFTSMSAESTPMQVVSFLNDLYTVFDAIINYYDVYKVETIGDAYMVVSGLPIRNGDQHAGEIASMALELLESIKSFKIRHKPDHLLKLRIGIHTALKIHVSPDCKDYLDRLGGYILEKRGVIPIKGKGNISTFWLLGCKHCREPLEIRLPQPLFNTTCDSDFRPRGLRTTGNEITRRCFHLRCRDTSPASRVNDNDSFQGSLNQIPAFLKVSENSPCSKRSLSSSRGRIYRVNDEANRQSYCSNHGDIENSSASDQFSQIISSVPCSSREVTPNAVDGDSLKSYVERENKKLPNGIVNLNESQKPLIESGNNCGDDRGSFDGERRTRFKAPSCEKPSRRWLSYNDIIYPSGSSGTLKGFFAGLLGRRQQLTDVRRFPNPGDETNKLRSESIAGESVV
ncbi:receptor-type guanylate cyclase Gyc76C-like isoform X2 [Tachypleus tridentatus]|uniref:receptor-type guanylate cyclase Gyc76C-like isoform X2 n=1 Tax=Tachypleus tridentatus TaxID=6853 RepID=UPI003FD3B350